MPQTIVTTTEAVAAVLGMAALTPEQQADLVAAATSTINTYCGRVLTLAQHDELYEPENTRTVRLKEYPVVDVIRLATGLTTVITIRCVDTSASRAWTRLTFTGQGDDLIVSGVSLSATTGGVTITTPLLFSSYRTVGALAAAINALGGWAATVPTNSNPNASGQSFDGWATADINLDLGSKGAIGTGAAYWAFPRDLSVYDLSPNRGTITIHEDLYQTHRYPDRMYPASGQFGSVRCIYTAGYNNDPIVGPVTMPGDLKRAAYTLIQATLQRTTIGLLKSESISQRQVVWADAMQGTIGLVSDVLNNYRRRRLT